jgi:hypothetical protein
VEANLTSHSWIGLLNLQANMQLSAATPRNVYKGVSNFFIFPSANYLVHYLASFIIIIIVITATTTTTTTTTTIIIIIIIMKVSTI